MFITYRRTGGIFAVLTFAAVAFAATVLTVVGDGGVSQRFLRRTRPPSHGQRQRMRIL